MKYFELNFHISVPEESMMQDARDLLAALSGEAGLETFEETDDGLRGYVQQALFEQTALDDAIADFPIEGTRIRYDVSEAEYQDWNAEWEAGGFEPIVVGDGRIVVHDGRHLPELTADVSIEIDAKMAFGTGTHETTRLMLMALIALTEREQPSALLDCGTGTGILAIAALKLGVSKAVGYDIDEWSVDNARHNAIINQVEERFTALLGDASVLNGLDETFDVVVANINRNILLSDMEQFVNRMHSGSHLLLSGFYDDDAPLLINKAKELGLTLEEKSTDNEWTCLQFILHA
ncbi:MAG: 50S ribosomal protein L11 methyltransferase [Prevotella sp.]|nr:50S ribosomal protein L11 methyltransferase [Prevotella sp.]